LRCSRLQLGQQSLSHLPIQLVKSGGHDPKGLKSGFEVRAGACDVVQRFGHLIEHAFQIVGGFYVSAGAKVVVAGMPICGQTPFLGVGGRWGQNTFNLVLKNLHYLKDPICGFGGRPCQGAETVRRLEQCARLSFHFRKTRGKAHQQQWL
jgi:hypothetical protein